MSRFVNKISLGLFCIILSSLCFYFSMGFNNIWLLLWIAPIFPIIYAYHYDIKSSFIVSFLSFSLGSLSLLTYAHTILPSRIFLVPIILPALFFALILVVNAMLVKHLRHWLTIFFLPSLWTSYEFIVSLLAPSGPFNSLAFTQVKFLVFAQTASITGIWGMTFILLLVGSGMSYALYFKENTRIESMPSCFPCCCSVFV